MVTETRKRQGNHRWTDEERDIVRRDYRGTRQSARLIALKLSQQTGERITEYAVVGQCAKMGILTPKSPDWTAAELRQLEKMIHRYSVTQIARRLNRSCNAVKIKATRMQLGARHREEWFTKKECGEILGCDHHKVQKWIDAGALKARPHGDKKPQHDGMAMWHIELSDLKAFIMAHSGELTSRNVDLQTITWILTGQVS